MKNGLIAFAAILVIIGGVVLFQSSDNDSSGGSDTFASNQQLPPSNDDETASTDSSAEAEVEGQSEPVAPVASTNNYVKYTEDGSEIEDAAGTKRVVFFHAPWCPVCNAFEDDIKEQGVPADMTIIQADFDDDVALKQRYGVTQQSTFVLLDDAGEVVQTWPFGQGLRGGISDLYEQVSNS